MEISVVERRVCGDDIAYDFFLERELEIAEIEKISKDLRGQLSAFGALYYIDINLGRLSLSSNSQRCSLRTKKTEAESKERVFMLLTKLSGDIKHEVVK